MRLEYLMVTSHFSNLDATSVCYEINDYSNVTEISLYAENNTAVIKWISGLVTIINLENALMWEYRRIDED